MYLSFDIEMGESIMNICNSLINQIHISNLYHCANYLWIKGRRMIYCWKLHLIEAITIYCLNNWQLAIATDYTYKELKWNISCWSPRSDWVQYLIFYNLNGSFLSLTVIKARQGLPAGRSILFRCSVSL